MSIERKIAIVLCYYGAALMEYEDENTAEVLTKDDIRRLID